MAPEDLCCLLLDITWEKSLFTSQLFTSPYVVVVVLLHFQSFKAPIFSLVLIWQQPPLRTCAIGTELCWIIDRLWKDTAITMHYLKWGLIIFLYFARAKTRQCYTNSKAWSKLHGPLIFEGKSHKHAANCCHMSVVLSAMRYSKRFH